MGYRYQKRIHVGKGLGLNVSTGGVSSSYRTKFGSIGTRGFSFRTGIPGLSFRRGWGKQGGGIVLIIILSVGIFIILYNLFCLGLYLFVSLYHLLKRMLRKRSTQQTSG